MFLQTKFTSLNGQDPNNIPYNKNAPLTEQVQQSFAKSLENLKTDYLDSLVLHSPMGTLEDTMTVWRVFERLYGEKRVLNLGISNCYELDMLKSIYAEATVKPVFLQNRFYKTSGYDRAIRQFCREHGITYQSFWTLTANPTVVQSSTITAIANKYGKTNTQVFFRFLQTQVCCVVLCCDGESVPSILLATLAIQLLTPNPYLIPNPFLTQNLIPNTPPCLYPPYPILTTSMILYSITTEHCRTHGHKRSHPYGAR